jgi:hypothetical protein
VAAVVAEEEEEEEEVVVVVAVEVEGAAVVEAADTTNCEYPLSWLCFCSSILIVLVHSSSA